MRERFRKVGARWAAGLLLCLAALLQVSGDLRLDPIERLDTFIAGLRMRLTPAVHDPRIVIVDIDEKSIAKIGHFPWNRKVMAQLTSRLTEHYGVAAVGYDIVFAEADDSSGYGVLDELAHKDLKDVPGFAQKVGGLKEALDYDGLLVKALRDRPVVLGYTFTDAERKGKLPAPAFRVDDLNGRVVPASGSKGYIANLPRLQDAAAGGGVFTASLDADGILRNAALLVRIGDGYYPTLSLATVAAALGASPPKPVFPKPADQMSASELATAAPEAIGLWIGSGKERRQLQVRVGENLSDAIEFRGPGGRKGGAFTYVSASDVIEGRVQKPLLEGNIVLVGTTVPGLNDLRSTPVNPEYPGVEVHANMIKSILDDTIKFRPDYADAVDAIVLVASGIALALALPLLSPLPAVLLTLALAGAVCGFNYYAYHTLDWMLRLGMSLTLIAGLFVLNLAWGYFFEFRKGRALVSRFGEYVAPELVAKMAENPEAYNMDGESRELSVMFVDVRGFTTISEGLSPKALREYINIYLTAMSEDIRASHQGTLDKYIGDAVMAFWGAPVAFPDHASRAVATSLRMQASSERLNRDFLKRGWPELKIGIGINTGHMHVGDMGSSIRRAYTVMGDAVNLGSRLEGITKVYGVGIAVGAATRLAAPEFVYRELDLVRVKGKNEPVAIFEPLGKAAELAPGVLEELRDWDAALALVRAQQWDQAQGRIEALRAAHPERGLYQLYLERIAVWRAQPPGEGWDGVTTFDSK
ncbi:Adenylate cyclase 1 [Massilia sp. Bi118]|uniref:CHASE2 domain-containing protein n=1 Tax=Massilia sp. Bi118 TaxID=2822346 RepID=UPI001D254073|nr:adenylate/guanylate cyclase domain-containing protein [Massilia sp. Bi118]CAH0232639.1 Adenylate cyclase 1 [Massilia sp. Bi118]